jgi:hypothetical protein
VHGVIFSELQAYVKDRLGDAHWYELLKLAGLGTKTYMSFQEYPDEEILSLVAAASTATGVPAPELLEDFGRFIAKDLIYMHPDLVQPGWRTLDLIQHTENVMHRAARKTQPGAYPPALHTERQSARVLLLTYTSGRQLCPLARGIIQGIAAYYTEQVEIAEPTCMLRGDPACTLRISLA